LQGHYCISFRAIIVMSCFKVLFIDITRPVCEWVSSSVILRKVLWTEMISLTCEYVVILIAGIVGQVTILMIAFAGIVYFNIFPRTWLDAL
jgi:hypothetical protein